MPDLSVTLPLLVTSAATLVTSLLYLREYYLRRKIYQQQRKISQLKMQKVTQLLDAAEDAQTHVVTDSSYAAKKVVVEFKTQLQEMLQNSQQAITQSQTQLIEFMDDLQKRGSQFEEASVKFSQQRINQVLEGLEAKLSDFLIQTEQKTTSSIELELKAARQLIETYKEQQFKLIDENVIAMMEQTLNIVLAKKLSLKEQLDLVYEALERAKVEKFIV